MPTRPDPRSRYEVTDVAVLKLLAHPLRSRMLGLLRLEGDATASELGRRLGESSGATSYHLRQLAHAGLIEEAPEQPSRRERVWRASHALTSFDAGRFAGSEGRAVLEEFGRMQLRRLDAEATRWLQRRGDVSPEWTSAGGISDYMARLTPAATVELTERVSELLHELEERHGDAPDAGWVSIHWLTLPLPDEEVVR